jgi:pyridoxine 5-phosphate synthase
VIALSVNVNKVALLRNSRDTVIPSVVEYSQRCIGYGAHGITVHPRPDQRHIRVDDCFDLKRAINVELNIEGNPFSPAMPSSRRGVSDYPGFMALVDAVRPAQCTLVPDANDQLTSDHGFDLARDADKLRPVLKQLSDWGVRSSVFVDPNPDTVAIAADLGADRVEIYTESFARDFEQGRGEQSLKLFSRTAEAAYHAGLEINAGHDLNLDNLPLFSGLPHLAEVSIGHALTADALYFGLEKTINLYLTALQNV